MSVDRGDTNRERRGSAAASVAAAAIGNALEWFDLISYGFFAPVIARIFFPDHDPGLSLLIALATFGVAYVSRPLGGIILGVYADRKGRKAALLVSMFLMMAGTLLIAFTPGYASIGFAAPCLIVVARLLQGFSAGGEFANATAFLAEQSPDRRAFYSSWQFASQGLATVLGAAFGVTLTATLSPAQIDNWGWRIPFVFGLLIGPIALFIRRHIDETPEFQSQISEREPPMTSALYDQLTNVMIALGSIILATVGFYMLVYMPAYGVSQLGLTPSDGFKASLAAGSIIFLTAPIAGLIADRVGRLQVAVPMAVLLMLAPIPLFGWLTVAPSSIRMIVVQSIVALLIAGYTGTLGAFLTELFPVRTRSTGMSLSYNVSVMTFGGFAPFAMAWLIERTGWIAAPSYYLVFGAAISLAALFAAFRRSRATSRSLDNICQPI